MISNITSSEIVLFSLVSSQIGIYFVMRYRVSALEKNVDTFVEERKICCKDMEARNNACFKSVDRCQDRVTVLERDTSTHLNLSKAEERFVSKAELELHLKNIETITTNTNQNVDKMMGKLEDLTDILHANIVKT